MPTPRMAPPVSINASATVVQIVAKQKINYPKHLYTISTAVTKSDFDSCWLSFKNMFNAMMDSQTDLSDVKKL